MLAFAKQQRVRRIPQALTSLFFEAGERLFNFTVDVFRNLSQQMGAA